MFKGAEITFWNVRIVLVDTNFIVPLMKICLTPLCFDFFTYFFFCLNPYFGYLYQRAQNYTNKS